VTRLAPLAALAAVVLARPLALHAQPAPVSSSSAPASATARGPFDVTLAPQTDAGAPDQLGRMTIDKRFHGDLDATSQGQMLSAMTGTKGSAGYVAIERVTGTLGGRRGSFVLQHSGTMTRGAPSLVITVVPDSGTDGLAGLAGTMAIDVAPGGKHSYAFTYTLPPAAPAAR
jgi:hypothetical protein